MTDFEYISSQYCAIYLMNMTEIQLKCIGNPDYFTLEPPPDVLYSNGAQNQCSNILSNERVDPPPVPD